MNGSDLLDQYRQSGSEHAFSELVRRFADLVYSVAKRRVESSTLAKDVAQAVFTRLAQSPPKLATEVQLAVWLHRTTVHVATGVWRSEIRRRNREQRASAMQTPGSEDAEAWEEIAPHLDGAINQLSEPDRQAILLRFFQRKLMRDLGQDLGVSEAAAKMRVGRTADRPLRTAASSHLPGDGLRNDPNA